MTGSHRDKVHQIAAQIAARPSGTHVTIRKTTPSHSIRNQAYKKNAHPVDVSALTEVIEIDSVERVAVAEGQVTIEQLCKAALPLGFVPAVVPEMRKFTVSGLINGEGIQSSSHRYGVFTMTLKSIEVLQAGGSLVTASADSNPELFSVLPESLGTLGIVTAASVRIVPAKRYVKLSYRRFRKLDEYLTAFKESLGQHDFHEGVIYGPRTFILFTGNFVDEPEGCSLFDPWKPGGEYYYQHIRALMTRRAEAEEVLETLSYFSRSERGFWWALEGRTGLPLLSETAWGRRQMDKTADQAYNSAGFTSSNPSVMGRDRCMINQDMGVRLERLGSGIEWVQEHLKVYPIWNCAVHLAEKARSTFGTSHLVDIGIYGEPMARDYQNVRDLRALQKFVDAPSMWGTSYLMWDEIVSKNPERFRIYERVRLETGAAEAFLHIKDKVVWVDPDTPSSGKIFLWRLRDSLGRYWYLNPLSYILLLAGAFSKCIWPRSPAVE